MKLVVAVYLVSLLPFALTGLYRLTMLVRLLRLGGRERPRPRHGPGESARVPDRRRPHVTVQIPLYDERYVAERVIRAAAAMDYPRDRLEIQILDDSTDATSAVVARVVASLPRDLDVRHVRRARRTGYKAGALAAGLETARGELVAIFDADFVPRPSFLHSLVAEFDDPRVGMVQARWGYLNDDYSILTEAQAALLNAHFGIEHPVRYGHGLFFNFNGTAGIWRRAAIDDAGGWRFDSLTEDLDLSYRAQLRGWRFVFRGDVDVPSELPVDIRGFRTQQYRWSRGMTEVARRALPRLWRAPIALRVKVDATLHLLSNVGYVFVCVMSLTLVPTFYVHGPQLASSAVFQGLSALFTFTNLGVVAAFLFAGDARLTGRPRRSLRRVAALLPIGVATAVCGAEGFFRGLRGRPSPFVRTPKHDVVGRRRRPARGYTQPASLTALVEALFALYHAAWVVVILRSGRLDLLPLSAVFLAGYVYFAGCELSGRRSWRGERTPARSPHVPGRSGIEGGAAAEVGGGRAAS